MISDGDGVFQGVAHFDLGFCISGKVYLLTFAEGQFIRKTEREYREKLFEEGKDKFIFKDLLKPAQNNEFDIEFINQLVNTIPSLEQFPQKKLPHGIYYPEGLNINP